MGEVGDPTLEAVGDPEAPILVHGKGGRHHRFALGARIEADLLLGVASRNGCDLCPTHRWVIQGGV
jgi:hypothetical protein